ncbi:MAG: hypothetical protein KDB61_13975, partial [Planctomycetes bacterium]|nr:hypothetical protein [Planctomycetota bacterium]
TADALCTRGGSSATHEVFDIAQSRGIDWWPYVVRGLARHPDEVFREVFEWAAKSDDWDTACLGQRGLGALDQGQSAVGACLTSSEFHALWLAPSMSTQVPEVLDWDEWIVRLRKARVVVLGELHVDLPIRAAQIAVLAELLPAKKSKVVLVAERPVLEFQEPVLAAARQFDVEIRTLESEALAFQASPAERDQVARQVLAEMVRAEPETTFVVCYGDNHRRSLRAALAEAGVESIGVTTSAAEGMLGSAIRATGGRIQGRVFGYPGDLYYLPESYATHLGCPQLDEAFLPAASR